MRIALHSTERNVISISMREEKTISLDTISREVYIEKFTYADDAMVEGIYWSYSDESEDAAGHRGSSEKVAELV